MKSPTVTREPIIHVDCTPNSGYPLRILKAYRENTKVLWELTGDFPEQTRIIYEEINKASKLRGKILDIAISILEKANLTRDLYIDFDDLPNELLHGIE